MACSIFDDRDGFIDEADPVSPLSNPDAGTGTAVLERRCGSFRPLCVARSHCRVPSHRPTGGGVVRQGVGAEA